MIIVTLAEQKENILLSWVRYMPMATDNNPNRMILIDIMSLDLLVIEFFSTSSTLKKISNAKVS